MQITVDDQQLRQKLAQLKRLLTNTEPLMRDISRTLVSETLKNFQAGGRPKWAGLSPQTIAARRKNKGGRVAILQDTGMLKGSVQHHFSRDSASIGAGSGASARYAAIHQFGGMAGRNHAARIPARPYLPMDAAGQLQPEAEKTLHDVVDAYLQRRTLHL